MRFKVCLLFLLALPSLLIAQEITQMEFRDQPVKDILMVLAEVSGSSIVPDETVEGNATYFFSHTDLDTALAQFLSHYGFFHEKRDGTYYISRIQTRNNEGLISCRSDNADLQSVIRRLSRDLEITILHDALPNDPVTLNYTDGSLEDLLEIVIKPFPLFYLEKGDRYFYLRKKSVDSSGRSSAPGDRIFTREGREYGADFRQVRFREALIDLMEQEGVEFSFLGRNDNVIEIFRHSGKSFSDMLGLLLEQGNASCKVSSGVYYIFDRDRQDILKSYYTTLRIPLENIAVNRINSLIPSNMSSSGALKLDEKSNSVILSGSLDQISPLEAFIRELDTVRDGREYRRYDLQYINVENFKNRLSPEWEGISLIELGERSFIAGLSEEKSQSLSEYLRLVDASVPVYPIQLKYLTWEKLNENLPPSVSEDQLHSTQNESLFFFTGTAGEWQMLKDQLDIMDKPTPQIRYEVLVLQLEDSQGLDLDTGLTTQNADRDSTNGFSGNLAGLASVTFDVVSQFGYQFAANLSLELSSNRSRVLADTTLYGLSGEEISFQNTNTSRHPVTQVDSDTGETEITGYREITSGLIVKINGWVSGDGMVTLEIESTISSQTEGDSNDEDSIPTTTEKVIDTHVRSASGKPIVISGLKQRETVEQIKKIPLFGDIPFLGYLFQKRSETLKNTEFLVTLIPYREDEESRGTGEDYASLYETFCRRDNP